MSEDHPEPADEPQPDSPAEAGKASAHASADASADASAEDGAPAAGSDEPVTRLVIVVLGIAILALATWWLSPGGDDSAPESVPQPETPEQVTPTLVISVFGGIDDRYFVEPCTRIYGGGLDAIRAAVDLTRDETIKNHLGVSLGDISRVPGRAGIGVNEILLGEVLPETGIDVMAAGFGELQHGVAYARGALAPNSACSILCANALDSDGSAILRGWTVTSSGGHHVLSVAVAAESIGYELLAAGSDVRIGPAVEFAARALSEGESRAADVGSPVATRLLLVQGTTQEAVEIARAAPGFDAVVASRGGVLPALEPIDVDGTPLFYAGRGARFAWQLASGEDVVGIEHRLSRIGERAGARGSPYRELLYGVGARLLRDGYPRLAIDDVRTPDPRGEYVGSVACAECHPDEAVQHAASPHVRVSERVLKGPFAASPACVDCHLTAAFRRTGWLPGEDEVGLVGVSCERCHGPASSHVAEPGPGYGAVDYATCYGCHLPDKSPQFDARAAWSASGHGAPPAPPEAPPVPDGPVDDGDEDERAPDDGR